MNFRVAPLLLRVESYVRTDGCGVGCMSSCPRDDLYSMPYYISSRNSCRKSFLFVGVEVLCYSRIVSRT